MLDVQVPYAQLLNVPKKFCLELMAMIGADCMNANGEHPHQVIDEINYIGLGVALIDSQGPNPGSIVNCGELKAPDPFARWCFQVQECYV